MIYSQDSHLNQKQWNRASSIETDSNFSLKVKIQHFFYQIKPCRWISYQLKRQSQNKALRVIFTVFIVWNISIFASFANEVILAPEPLEAQKAIRGDLDILEESSKMRIADKKSHFDPDSIITKSSVQEHFDEWSLRNSDAGSDGSGSDTLFKPLSDVVGVSDGDIIRGIVEIGPDLVLHPDVQKAAFYLNGTKSGKVDQSPFLWGGLQGNGTQGFDTQSISDGAYTLTIVYTDSTGDHTVDVSFVVKNAKPIPDPEPPAEPVLETKPETAFSGPDSSNEMIGVKDGAMVQGVIQVAPNLEILTGVQKVAYYLNGTKSGKVVNAPFMWGGVNGDGTTDFDTHTLKDGSYTLTAVYTDQTGDHTLEITFTVNNSNVSVPEPLPQSLHSDMNGLKANDIVKGLIHASPNLQVHPDIRKVFYYLNGEQYGRVYQSPFTWGGLSGVGTTGFDTQTLANGSYELRTVYTDSTGDHVIQIPFIVENN